MSKVVSCGISGRGHAKALPKLWWVFAWQAFSPTKARMCHGSDVASVAFSIWIWLPEQANLSGNDHRLIWGCPVALQAAPGCSKASVVFSNEKGGCCGAPFVTYSLVSLWIITTLVALIILLRPPEELRFGPQQPRCHVNKLGLFPVESQLLWHIEVWNRC